MKFTINKLYVNKHGYHPATGRHLGQPPEGKHMYVCRCTKVDITMYIWAVDRQQALQILLATYPDAYSNITKHDKSGKPAK
jgi:hypothetical protein